MNSEDNDRVSRRRFLQSVGVAGVVGLSGSFLAACGGSDDSGDGSSESTSTASGNCSDLSDLSDAQKKQRSQMVKSLQYVEETPQPKKRCDNCQLYVKGDYGEGCGGCQLFPGPVTNNGYCNSWAPAS